ncbi:hypothetical protein BKI52_43650 [marine bacterium AO1-C]|nr:hypothetical protein BKI52_43650 [marine bacterium AO1-C]
MLFFLMLKRIPFYQDMDEILLKALQKINFAVKYARLIKKHQEVVSKLDEYNIDKVLDLIKVLGYEGK